MRLSGSVNLVAQQEQLLVAFVSSYTLFSFLFIINIFNRFAANPFAAAVAMIVIPMLCEQSEDMPFTVKESHSDF